ncbi:D-arabinono-1,4-lactone oxidase [Microbacterium sp. M3]|uniref:D-arabinono-1,4-lactone oxidase n=1 Tax=Microbacterium arthrosphaerae TaxID=792652 RepID=A0ABU4GVY9_9MICO|nr:MULTISPECIES: D-arabinono-1,4-lactone oxidase [Microbacterium]MDW4571231.1 D-arabinono-1,4-lactone oxidase [Microbacterium arthrosphaerae]MDW7605086.1 D-arabinono-1,4-lactone oxidase [Microbacterium sp. M3]
MTRPGGVWRNWGRSESVRPQRVEFPRTIAAVQRAVRAAAAQHLPVKAVGAGHSFTGIAVAPGVLLELRDLSGLVKVDADRGRVTLLAGTRLHQVPGLLAPYGLAMENLGDIDRQSISGAISTGTHGTGARFGGIAAQVVGATLVTASGELLRVDEDENPELVPAVALGLGALGILVEVTLQCVPAFVLHAVERPEALDDVLAALDDRVAAADHFEFYWFPHTDRAMTKTNTRLPESAPRHPLPAVGKWVDDTLVGSGLHQIACTTGKLVPALVPPINRLSAKVWGDREFTDASARVFATYRSVRFREMEYALPAAQVRPAFDALRALVDERGWRIGFPVEVRFAAADDRWLSTAHGRASGYIAVHRYWREDPTEYFEAVEEIMLRFDGRPHWGKMHTLGADTLRERYPRFEDFTGLRDRLDPERIFRNPYLDRVLGG